MNKEQAEKIAGPFLKNDANVDVIITSDHGVFLNTDKSKKDYALTVCKHAVRNKLQYFVIKGDEPTIEEINAAISEQNNSYLNNVDDARTVAQEKIDEKAFKELMKSAKHLMEKKNYQKARAEYAQAMKLRPDDADAKQGHEDAYSHLVDAAKELDEKAKAEQAKRDELIRKLGLQGDASDDEINEALEKRDAINAAKKADELKARAIAAGLDENATEDEIKAAEKKAKKKK